VIKIFAGSSKLIIIYILTVLVSGSILTWLSINNISNFEELTEKRITEEEKTIIEKYGKEFQSLLEILSEELAKVEQSDSISLNESGLEIVEKLVKDFLIMNSDGVLTRPHVVYNNYSFNNGTTSKLFTQKYKLAEQNEFVQKDFEKSEKLYLNSLRDTSSKSDSAKVYNAVARLYNKNGEQKKAFDLYSRIINDFSFTLNDYGFPYAYFSLNQLMKLDNKVLVDDKENLLFVFLNDLLNNNIPFANSIDGIISDLQNETKQILNKEAKLKIDSLCNSVIKKVESLENYRKPMFEIVTGKTIERPLRLNNSFIVNGTNNDEIMLMFTIQEDFTGFIVPLENIHNSVIQNIETFESSFEYNIELIDVVRNEHFLSNELVVTNSFSSFFTKKQIQVRLKDATVFEVYVFRRKLITAFGLILLLVAMGLGLYTLIRDVNRKKRMDSMRADFVSNVTHELKTPLTSINMLADSIVLGKVNSDEKIKKYANVIVKESENLKRMINNILDFSRKESNKLNYYLKDCNLAEILAEIMREMNYWLEINNFEVVLEIQNEIIVLANQDGIKQVLSNLISNAIKYSQTNKKLIIRLFKEGDKAFLEVEDFGIGIPEDKQKLIFQKFYRVRSGENNMISGTGLGLTVSMDIIEAMNGKLLVKSKLNKGSKFTIVFNLKNDKAWT
jgi:signal transduction histidine kinase